MNLWEYLDKRTYLVYNILHTNNIKEIDMTPIHRKYLKDNTETRVTSVNTEQGNEFLVNIPSGYKYLDEVFNTFPDNSFLCKSVAGVGGTTLAITNTEDYVIAGSSVELVINKADQHDNLIPVYAGVYAKDIIKEVNTKRDLGIPVKIITTYDSLYKVVDALGIYVQDYKLLVDELQVLLKASDKFKPRVVTKVLEQVELFKSVCFMTATPTPRKYFPPEISKLDYYRVSWEDSEKMVVNKANIKGDMNKKVTAIALHHLDNGGTPIFFYNSLSGIIPCIKNLIKVRGITYKDVKIICANTEANKAYLKEQLGKDWLPEKPLYKEINESGEVYMNPKNKPIQFCTKYAFEGLDFSVEDAYTYVISDVKNKHRHHTRIDISTDLQQVAGRCRNQNPLSKRECVFLWNDSVEGADMTEEVYEEYVREELAIAKDMEERYTMDRIKSMKINLDTSPYFVEVDGVITTNEYAIYGMCISYAALNVDYVNVMVDGKKTTRMEEKLDLFSQTKGFKLPELSVIDKSKMKNKQSFKELSEEYYNLVCAKDSETCADAIKEIDSKLKVIKSLDKEFTEILNTIGIEGIKSTSFNKTKSRAKYNKVVGVGTISRSRASAFRNIKIKEGDFLLYSEIKERIQKCFDKQKIDVVAKATDIKEVFNVKRTTRGGVEGFLIGEKI